MARAGSFPDFSALSARGVGTERDPPGGGEFLSFCGHDPPSELFFHAFPGLGELEEGGPDTFFDVIEFERSFDHTFVDGVFELFGVDLNGRDASPDEGVRSASEPLGCHFGGDGGAFLFEEEPDGVFDDGGMFGVVGA